MSEKLIISLDASKDRPETMTVQDVFTHVLELFQLVSDSDPDLQGQIEWRLVSASMNSPFTVTAEAVAAKPGVLVDDVAMRQKRAFRTNYSELRVGRMPRAWSNPKNRETVSRVMARNRNGIGTTSIDYGIKSDIGPILITAEDAVAATVPVATIREERKTKDQVGSVEGRIIQVATHYHQPAILIDVHHRHARTPAVGGQSGGFGRVGKV